MFVCIRSTCTEELLTVVLEKCDYYLLGFGPAVHMALTALQIPRWSPWGIPWEFHHTILWKEACKLAHASHARNMEKQEMEMKWKCNLSAAVGGP